MTNQMWVMSLRTLYEFIINLKQGDYYYGFRFYT